MNEHNRIAVEYARLAEAGERRFWLAFEEDLLRTWPFTAAERRAIAKEAWFIQAACSVIARGLL